MNVRSLTVGAPLAWPLDPATLDTLGAFVRAVRAALTDGGFEVQTVRLAGPPLSDVVGSGDAEGAVSYARDLEAAARERGFDYVSIGPVRVLGAPEAGDCHEALTLIEALPDLIRRTETVFCSVAVATRQDGIHLPAIQRTAAAIAEIGATTEAGFGNLRFAALANCPAHIPFFPAAYHEGSQPGFGLALEAADLAVWAFTEATTLDDARQRLLAALDAEWRHLDRILRRWTNDPASSGHTPRFNGVDLSLAPYPEDSRSIAAALEHLGVARFGAAGTLFAAAFLTSILGETRLPRTGFSGLMLPVLEDSRLAQRASEGLITVDSLLLYSAVCGLGLDTVPLPGAVSRDELAGIILDMATLAVRLDKPLTARLLPVPGKRAGDRTTFDFPYFANSRVLAVRGLGAAALLAKGDIVGL